MTDHSRAAAHYTALAAELKAEGRFEGRFHVGDRVQIKGRRHLGEFFVLGLGTDYGDAYCALIAPLCCPSEAPPRTEVQYLTELVHVAPPGVPMVAMTPERVRALNFVMGYAFGGPEPPAWLNGAEERVLKGLLAEARGEVKP